MTASQDTSIKFTCIVVTYNEAGHLRECLNSLAFCEQLIVIDLGSTDASVKIAKQCGAEVVPHTWVPIVEQTWPVAISLARNEWIVRLDPDEIFPPLLIDNLVNTISRSESLALVSLPHRYYFRGILLNTTIWGGIKYVAKVFHRNRVQLRPFVHRGILCINGYKSKCIKGNSKNSIQHYWADTFIQLFEKHWRYIKREGEARYVQGERFSWPRWLKDTIAALKLNLFYYKGIHGGFAGVFLSIFYAWYVSMSLLSLARYQKCMDKAKESNEKCSKVSI